jgi:NAD(P)-dependent dehydrogenase (short-subunit alcohol dehydrogenase family)
MTSDVDGRVVVVTGGSRGIGRAIALAFARDGAAVAICGRDREALDGVLRELGQLRAEAIADVVDVADETAVNAFGLRVKSHFRRVDVVVANAGIAGPTKPMHQTSLEEWRQCLTADLDSVFLTFKAFLPPMLEAQRGALIAISSMTGKRPLHGRTPYAAAKMGVIGLVRTLALEVGPSGITVNCVCPGAVRGPRIEAVVRNQAEVQGISEESALRQFTDSSALGRLVRDEEVASTCVFLASDAARAITGEDLNVSAGTVMY